MLSIVTKGEHSFNMVSAHGDGAQSSSTLIGKAELGPVFEGPFGSRRIVYADFTASGRSLPVIERALEQLVLPFYGNTHSEASHTGSRTTHLRDAARLAVRRGVNAGANHAVIFCGSGSTAAVNKLLAIMGLTMPAGSRERRILEDATPEGERPVVFVGPYEHHSNELPWRESIATVVRIPLDVSGRPCMTTLEQRLIEYNGRPKRIVALSAASNVTGVITDLQQAARTTHRHGGLLFVDFAAGAPYLPIDMLGSGDDDHLDAVFLSPHKFLGGPGSSGILVADRSLSVSEVPTCPGGGTVRFVTPLSHRYIADLEQREEAGTPAILSDIRAGLVIQLKSEIGTDAIHDAEQRAIARALDRWRSEPAIQILGPTTGERLAIFSFNIQCGNRSLHHGYVVQLLNDLFGIQARGGCSCAGPYGHELLGIEDDRSRQYQEIIEAGNELVKPGWVRLGLHYTLDDDTLDAIIEAVAFIARRGRDLLSIYTPDVATARWVARSASGNVDHGWDELCAALRGERPSTGAENAAPDFARCLSEANRLADEARGVDVDHIQMAPEAEALRWFWLPGEPKHEHISR